MASDLNVQLEDLMGPAWADIWCNQKYLFLPGWCRGFKVGELRLMFWKVARVRQLKRQVAQLERDMARRVAECEAAETRCEFYRNQCQMEANSTVSLVFQLIDLQQIPLYFEQDICLKNQRYAVFQPQ